jgi:peptide/nickel transport system ATP-binding protein/oligopeptide transport system ATP-binding protein
MAGASRLLDVQDLSVHFGTPEHPLKAVDGISFTLDRGETLGVVGESGCGKSVACMSITRLNPSPPARYPSGSILFDGFDTLKMNRKQLQALRGARVGVIFQEPMVALNPVFTIGHQIVETLMLHLPVSRTEAKELALDALRRVRAPEPSRVFDSYSFTLSGGLRQRCMIAMALCVGPDLLIADEPTTALDVTIQAGVMSLIRTLKEESGMAVILVSHDLSLVSESASRILVMYAGKICETAQTSDIVSSPLHPYTRGLIASRPSGKYALSRLTAIPGMAPSLEEKPAGCPFHPRCPEAGKRCAGETPELKEYEQGHFAACWNIGGHR